MTEDALAGLLAGMTVREKLGQLTQLTPEYCGLSGTAELTGPAGAHPLPPSDRGIVGSILGCSGAEQVRAIQQEHLRRDRNHIPLLFMADVIHGYRTILPIPLALSCSFLPDAARRAARIAAVEGAAAGLHVTFSPMADLVRDPRWGRVMEASGEDPLLNSRMSAAAVEGYQQAEPGMPGVLASCVKHFAAYGAPEGGREYSNVELSSHAMEESYLPGYHAALEAGASMVMAAFNTVDHVPAAANVPLLRDLLRGKWGFSGVLISDYGAVDELISHTVADCGKTAARKALDAGVDIEMMSTHYLDQGEALLDEGALSPQALDEAVLRVLRLKNELGLFEDPFAGMKAASEAGQMDRHRQAALDIALRCPVLLKNENGALPVSSEETVGLTGPFALEKGVLGGWSAGQTEGVSLWEGLSSRLAPQRLIYGDCGSLGSLLEGADDIPPIREEHLRRQLASCQKVLVAVGENQNDTGEGASKTCLRLTPRQEALIHTLKAMDKTVIAIIFSGRPLELTPVVEDCDAILQAWFLGSESGNALGQILLGHAGPSGKLSMSFPRTVGQIPVYYSQLPTGRPPRPGGSTRYAARYLDCPSGPLFPFGWGLTYGACQLSDLKVEDEMIRVTLSNTGAYPARETVQLYIAQKAAAVARPEKLLKDFRQVEAAPGEKVLVEFPCTREMFSYPRLGRQVFEPGSFTVMAGLNSSCLLRCSLEMSPERFDALRKEAL